MNGPAEKALWWAIVVAAGCAICLGARGEVGTLTDNTGVVSKSDSCLLEPHRLLWEPGGAESELESEGESGGERERQREREVMPLGVRWM